jgi:lysine 2,3-aminomutase
LVRISAEQGLRAPKKLEVKLTSHLENLIDRSDPNDPIARQYVYTPEEGLFSASERSDPVGDGAVEIVPRLCRKYPDRVLLKVISVCAAYCRFCFRKEEIGSGSGMLTDAQLEDAVTYISSDRRITEVILSGGDPLLLTPTRLQKITLALTSIPHVDLIRVHTRLPIVDPDRITPELVGVLGSSSQLWLSIHCNHPRELTPHVMKILSALANAGIPLVSQTVLLKNVNDNSDILEELFKKLIRARVKPYYLHHCDQAPGTKHFRTSLRTGIDIMRAMRGNVSGLCLPTYVIDIPGGYGKIPVNSEWVHEVGGGYWLLTDSQGNGHVYCDEI